MTPSRNRLHRLLLGTGLLALAACSDGGGGALDWDLRSDNALNTRAAAQGATAARPVPDQRGILSYPGYQVAVAQRGDTVASVAARIGMPAEELARYNAVTPAAPLNAGEVLALPRRVPEPAAPTATAAALPGGQIDVTTLAAGAIDRAEGAAPAASPAPVQTGAEPVRHRVARGETAFSVARAYGVSAKALAEWNGLPPDLAVREGQYLLIPPTLATAAPPPPPETAPGQGSPTPEPPSAALPLPEEVPEPASEPAKNVPASPELGAARTSASAASLGMPASGSIIRGYVPKKNDGIDIAAAAGAPVTAAAAGTVAAITTDTEQVPILVIRHADNLLTVYAGIDGIKVAKGDSVKRGQQIATVRAGDPAFLHFEVRKGFDAVDPMPYLQ